MNKRMRIGVDLGGTKIEGILLDDAGTEPVPRVRLSTPKDDYQGTIEAIVKLVQQLETAAGRPCSVGVGMPGALSAVGDTDGLVKNANSVWLNDRPFQRDLSAVLGRQVRCSNDANCLAVSEAIDGAGAGHHVVFAAILGTGCGAGVALGGRVHEGPNRVAGEWGHNPLPWPEEHELPGPSCYCGRTGCIETWVSGTGMERDHERSVGEKRTAKDIVARAKEGDSNALETIERYESRLARSLAHVVNLLDPDVIVLGGGMSNIERLYERLPELVKAWTFGGEMSTPIVPAKHGDSSGVRGAAWLWEG